jgi:Ser/Thr protein kinase RdoA (MazF antagonist)
MRSPLGMLGTGRATLAAGQTCPRFPIQLRKRLLRFFGLDPPPPVCARGQDVPECKPVLGGDGLVSRDCAQSGLPPGVPAIADLMAVPYRRAAVSVPGMSMSKASAFDSVLERMYQRSGVDTLPAHLERTNGITASKVHQLDIGVFRVDRSGHGTPLVARLFSAARPYAAAEADLAVLQYLAEKGFPAERPFGDHPLSSHDGQAVLVTEFIKEVPKAKRPPGPIGMIGAMIGRLHGLAVPAAADRPAGALHHFAEGTMADELRAVAGWLDAIEVRARAGGDGALQTLRTAVVTADGGDGLPEAFVHPDPVPKNAIFTASGPVLVDWTSAGRGPRLASMTLVLRSGWAAVPFMRGYASVVTLTEEERERLAGLLFSRALINTVFRVCRDPKTASAAAKKLGVVQRDSERTARELLAV